MPPCQLTVGASAAKFEVIATSQSGKQEGGAKAEGLMVYALCCTKFKYQSSEQAASVRKRTCGP